LASLWLWVRVGHGNCLARQDQFPLISSAADGDRGRLLCTSGHPALHPRRDADGCGGLTGRLVGLAKALVGHVRGGLGMVVMVAEIFFSGISGSSTADTSAMATLFIPSMLKRGTREGSRPQSSMPQRDGRFGASVHNYDFRRDDHQSIGGGAVLRRFLPAFVIAGFLVPLVYWQRRSSTFRPISERRSASSCGPALLLRGADDAGHRLWGILAGWRP